MKTTVDPGRCIGCELCVQFCPDVFTMDGEYATAMVDLVPADLETSCREAMESCPVEAIEIED
jgi:ferredoxin